MTEDSRWAAFADPELELIHGLAHLAIADVTDEAFAGEIPDGDREAAATTLLLAAKLAIGIDEYRQEEDIPGLEIFALTAELIKEGTYTETLQAALAAGSPPIPLDEVPA